MSITQHEHNKGLNLVPQRPHKRSNTRIKDFRSPFPLGQRFKDIVMQSLLVEALRFCLDFSVLSPNMDDRKSRGVHYNWKDAWFLVDEVTRITITLFLNNMIKFCLQEARPYSGGACFAWFRTQRRISFGGQFWSLLSQWIHWVTIPSSQAFPSTLPNDPKFIRIAARTSKHRSVQVSYYGSSEPPATTGHPPNSPTKNVGMLILAQTR